MSLTTTLPKEPVSGLREADRDLRLDACRGIALWFIFLDHIPENVGSWLTLRHYGFSDTTELFMFVSGVTCALAYGNVQRLDGWFAVISHTIRRSWEIYAAFLTLTVACVVMVYLIGDGQFADETNTRILFERPGPALARAAILQYRPVNTDVLPTFVLFHLLFAPLLWLLLKMPNLALGASFLLRAGSVFRLESAAMAEQRMVLQPVCVAVSSRAWRMVGNVRPKTFAVLADVAPCCRPRRPLFAVRPGRCPELEHQTA